MFCWASFSGYHVDTLLVGHLGALGRESSVKALLQSLSSWRRRSNFFSIKRRVSNPRHLCKPPEKIFGLPQNLPKTPFQQVFGMSRKPSQKSRKETLLEQIIPYSHVLMTDSVPKVSFFLGGDLAMHTKNEMYRGIEEARIFRKLAGWIFLILECSFFFEVHVDPCYDDLTKKRAGVVNGVVVADLQKWIPKNLICKLFFCWRMVWPW